MKKILLALVMVFTLLMACEKNEEKKPEKKNYPENIAYTVWLSKVKKMDDGGEAKMKLIFNESSVEVNILIKNKYGEDLKVLPSSDSRVSYKYSEGKGNMKGKMSFDNGRIRNGSGKEYPLFIKGNEVYALVDGESVYMYDVDDETMDYMNENFYIKNNIMFFEEDENGYVEEFTRLR